MSVTKQQVMEVRTAAGGWTKDMLEQWGVPWPPAKGWIDRLVKDSETPAWNLRQAQIHLNAAQSAIVNCLSDESIDPAIVGEISRIAIAVAGYRKMFEA